MKNSIVLISLVLAACSSGKDERFCECLAVSEELNTEALKYEAVALDKITDQDVATLNSLIKEKDSICSPYELLPGEELKKLREACK